MIPEKINNLLRVVKHGSNVNTYKVAWAKAIVEICPGAFSHYESGVERT